MNKKRVRRVVTLALALSVTLCAVPASLGFWNPFAQKTPASIATFAKTGTSAGEIVFSPEDFQSRVTAGAKLAGIIVEGLPDSSAGVLSLDGRPVMSGEGVTIDAVASLRFTPAAAEAMTTFSFIPVFEGITGKQSPVNVTIAVGKAANSAPVAQDVEAETFTGVYTEVKLSAVDADGDKILFQILDAPKLGAAQIDLDKCKYTPGGKAGDDVFTYVAVDTMGNSSKPAKIKISVKKNNAKMTYADMADNPAHYAALQLHKMGVITGQKIGASYFLNPAGEVTRNEFITMAVSVAGLETEQDAVTSFLDDDSIPTWAKSYVSAAEEAEIVNGYPAEGGLTVLNGDRTITVAEAAVILNNAANLADESRSVFFADADVIPSWAAQAAVNLDTVDVLEKDGDGKLNPQQPLTRGTACQMLYAASEKMNKR